MTTHKVKYIADGVALSKDIEADTHEAAAIILKEQFEAKRAAGQMMSEKITIFSECGWPEHNIVQ